MTPAILLGVADIVYPLRCGETLISVFPSIIFAFCMSLLFYRTLLSSNRQRFLRVFSRDLLIQEILFIWLINVSLKAWIFYLDVVDFVLRLYWEQITRLMPPANPRITIRTGLQLSEWLPTANGGPNLRHLPLLLATLLHPSTLKIIICTCTAIVPLIIMAKLNRQSDHPFAHLMIWLGMNRWERSELGLARYFVQRPNPAIADPGNDPPPQPVAAFRYSTGSLLTPAKTSVSIDGFMLQATRHQRPRFRPPRNRLRSSKSAT